MVDRSPATCWNDDNLNDDNCDHSGDRLSQNGEKQHGDIYIYFMATKIWFRDYYVAHEFVVKLLLCTVCVMCLK